MRGRFPIPVGVISMVTPAIVPNRTKATGSWTKTIERDIRLEGSRVSSDQIQHVKKKQGSLENRDEHWQLQDIPSSCVCDSSFTVVSCPTLRHMTISVPFLVEAI